MFLEGSGQQHDARRGRKGHFQWRRAQWAEYVRAAEEQRKPPGQHARSGASIRRKLFGVGTRLGRSMFSRCSDVHDSSTDCTVSSSVNYASRSGGRCEIIAVDLYRAVLPVITSQAGRCIERMVTGAKQSRLLDAFGAHVRASSGFEANRAAPCRNIDTFPHAHHMKTCNSRASSRNKNSERSKAVLGEDSKRAGGEM
ncbi:hypothetical protein OBBRIDRAFT_643841 [Obba rivulosa]|uniref:Uncharacterized protein n=1 Tax=Obba rivulosa TaxID=1052685 RepID=A0A8E2DSQ5_9APHY|nr:hypothetical protein OBBRIDRAFT_643841 [Obba rivulosa]